MEIDRRRALAGFWITAIGFILALLIASEIPTPAPPACYTAVCNTAYGTALLGLIFVIVGMVILGSALYRRTTPVGPPPPGFPSPQYSFTPPSGVPPPLATQPTLPAPAPVGGRCPGCGAAVTGEYGFCPRCGRTLTR